MPGLLQSTESGLASLKFVAAFFAELIGVLIFTLYGSAVAAPYGAWGNGITLAVLGECGGRSAYAPCGAIQNSIA